MPIFNNILAGASGQATGYDIDQSLRFNDGESVNLSKTPSSASNRRTWTWSCWVKRSDIDVQGHMFSAYTDGNNNARIFFHSDEKLRVQETVSNATQYDIKTTQLFRDAGAWYHIVVAVDTTQSTASDRIKIYVNGSQVTDLDTSTYPSLNYETLFNNTIAHFVGNQNSTSTTKNINGYLTEVHFIDGTALDASSFGETNSDTNQWQAIEYAGSYGTNGFYLKFQDSSALGDDSSGNTNDFTPTNLAATDQVLDRPTNNFATMNPLDDPNSRASGSTFSEGNLKVSEVGGNARFTMIGNFGMSSGKWYFEFCGVNSDNTFMLGIGDITKALSRGYTGTSGDGLFIYVDGDTYTGSTNASYGTSWTYGDVMGIAVDMDNNALYFAKNNTWMNSGDPTSGSSKTGAAFTTELAGKTWAACMGRGSTSNTITGTFNFGQDSSFAGAKTSQGNGPDGTDLYYDPPSGYIPMCTAQMDDPSIADPTAYFNTVLYTGDGNTTKSVNIGMNPDLVWVKRRDSTGYHSLVDTVRGDIALNSDQTIAEYSVSAFNFNTDNTIDVPYYANDYSMNTSSATYASWNWKAGGTASSNTDGTITSSVSANTTAGFSVVSYTGNSTAGATVGHGLSQAPELVIAKERTNADSWLVFSEPLGNTKALFLNETSVPGTHTTYWNDTSPSSTVVTLGSDNKANGSGTIIMYCFHGVDGYSKVGSYTGNGSTNGTFVYTGFRPAFILWKSTSAAENWQIQDNKVNPYNVVDGKFFANTNAAEYTGAEVDFVSNGFKLRHSGGGGNGSSESLIYLAFAESPFKYSNAR